MKHVKSLNKPMNSNMKKSGCGEPDIMPVSMLRHFAQLVNQSCENKN